MYRQESRLKSPLQMLKSIILTNWLSVVKKDTRGSPKPDLSSDLTIDFNAHVRKQLYSTIIFGLGDLNLSD